MNASGRRPLAASALLACAAVVATAVVGAAPASAAPTDTTTPDTSFSFRSASGDYIGGGATKSFQSPATAISVSGTNTHVSVSLHSTGYAEFFDADFAAGAGDTLHPGTYAQAERYPFQTGRAPGLSIDGDGRGCNQDFGEFTVNQIAFDTAGNVTTADITFVQHCESRTAPKLTGTLHYNALPLSYKQQSNPGDYVGGGVTKTYLNGTSLIDVTGSASSLQLGVSGLGDNWNAILRAPTGTDFVIGTTYATTRFGDSTHAALDVFGDGRGCNSSTGTLTITRLTVVGGSVTQAAASFVQHCEGATPKLTGTLHYYA